MSFHPDFYPWQQQQWDLLLNSAKNNQLPHALLFKGPAGTGKQVFARGFVKALLCGSQQIDGTACGHCKSCSLYEAGTHPDIKFVFPEEEGKGIKIDQIRELQDYLTLTSQYQGYKAVILAPAERMNLHAANSLLKSLEEPTPGTLIILMTELPGRLLPTIRSRCHQLAFPNPPRDQALKWLQNALSGEGDATKLLAMANGAPLQALQLMEMDILQTMSSLQTDLLAISSGNLEPLNVAEKWHKSGPEAAIRAFSGLIMALIRYISTNFQASTPGLMDNRDLQELAERLDLQELFKIHDRLNQAARLTSGQLNLQSFIEDLLIYWSTQGKRTSANRKTG